MLIDNSNNLKKYYKTHQKRSTENFIYCLYRGLTFTFFIALTIPSFGQSRIDTDSTGLNLARKQLNLALTDSSLHNVIDSKSAILDTEQKAIKFAEPILFDIYSSKNIRKQKPYKIYNIDGYWIINGTNKHTKGGVFLIIINSFNCKIIRLTHGK